MSKMVVFWGLLGVLGLGIAGAQEAKPEKAGVLAISAAIQPRAEGAVWRYRTGDYVNGKVTDITAAHEKVVEVKVIEGVTCFRIEQGWDFRTLVQRLTGLGEDLKGQSYYWEYWNENGSYQFEEDADDPKPPASLTDFELYLRYPAEKGFRYTALDAEYEVLGTAKKIKVPAGEFTCMVYECIWTDPDDADFSTRDLLYLSPGVGLVRWDSFYRNDDGDWEINTRENLLSYSLAEEKKGE